MRGRSRARAMSLRNRFTILFVAFAVLATTLEGILSWSAARRQLEESLDHRLLDVAGVAHQLALRDDAALLLLEPGAEGSDEWRRIQSTLQRLVTGFVDGADVFRWMPGDPVADGARNAGTRRLGRDRPGAELGPALSGRRRARGLPERFRHHHAGRCPGRAGLQVRHLEAGRWRLSGRANARRLPRAPRHPEVDDSGAVPRCRRGSPLSSAGGWQEGSSAASRLSAGRRYASSAVGWTVPSPWRATTNFRASPEPWSGCERGFSGGTSRCA